MSLRSLCELLEEGLEAVNSNGFFSGCDVLLENIEIVLSELNRYDNSQTLNNAISDLRRGCQLIQSLTERQGEPSTGRPRLHIPRYSLRYLLLTLNFKVTDISKIFGVSRWTVAGRLAEMGLSVYLHASATYSQIDDNQLCGQVRQILATHPDTGYKRLKGYLISQGIKVSSLRVLNALRTVDPHGVEHRRSCNRAINRRVYFVDYSMELWHIDTHHKLIRWGIVVRGGIDGKSRTIVYLECGADNNANSNFQSFMNGVREFGVPLRTRSDKGGENVDVARFMISTRGTGRRSHICGKSVHNQRIERLWRDVHYGCLSAYRRLFWGLEDSGHLDCDNQIHLAVLQFVFIPRINRSLSEFRQSWNHHPLQTERNRTPLQIMYMTLPPPFYDVSQNVTEENERLIIDENGLSAFEEDIPQVHVRNWTTLLNEDQRTILTSMEQNFNNDAIGVDFFLNAKNALA